LGGIIGVLFSKVISKDFAAQMNKVFGVSAMCMGINGISQMNNMPAVVISVVIGSVIGLAFNLGDIIAKFGEIMQRPINLIAKRPDGFSGDENEYTSMMVTVIVLFCAGSTGIYGSLEAGMTGNSTILISKSILDFFTAVVFACSLGAVVSVIAIPQLAVFMLMFFAAKLILPLTTPMMIGDFKACGGFLMVATGMRVAKIKDMPVADMLPAIVLVMPMSYFWSNIVVPLL